MYSSRRCYDAGVPPRDPLSRFVVWASVLLALGPVSLFFSAMPPSHLLVTTLGFLVFLAAAASIAMLGLGVSFWAFNAAMESTSWEPSGSHLGVFLWSRLIVSAALAWGLLAFLAGIDVVIDSLFNGLLAVLLPLPTWLLFTFVLAVEPHLWESYHALRGDPPVAGRRHL